MPYKSKAQQRFFHAAAERGDIPQSTVHEWDEATKHKKGGFGKLPQHKWKGGYAFGGRAIRPHGMYQGGGEYMASGGFSTGSTGGYGSGRSGEYVDEYDGALDRWLGKRRKMSSGGFSTGSPGGFGDGEGQYVDEEDGRLDEVVDEGGYSDRNYAEGGAVEPVWDPLDKQDVELFDEQSEDRRHAHEFARMFAGALAHHLNRRK